MTRKTHRPASFGAWLEAQLLRREWNQSDLARRVGVRPAVVSRWIRNERVPSPASADRIADALTLETDEVLTRAGHRPDLTRTALDALHARIDPHLRKVVGRPGADDAIVASVRNVVELLESISPPPASAAADDAESPAESDEAPAAPPDR